jgi:hypothetical protein
MNARTRQRRKGPEPSAGAVPVQPRAQYLAVISDYEERLAKQPAGDGCNLDDADVRSLRDIAR